MRANIRAKIFATALGLLLLMQVASFINTRLARDVGKQLEHVSHEYLPAYGAIASADADSLEAGLALRRLYLAYSSQPPDLDAAKRYRAVLAEKSEAFERDLADARARLGRRIGDATGFEDIVALARLDERIAVIIHDIPKYKSVVTGRFLPALESGDLDAARAALASLDPLRTELNERLDAARQEMLRLAGFAAEQTEKEQNQVLLISSAVTFVALLLGLIVAAVISSGMVAPLRRLLSATQEVEKGSLDTVVPVTSRDEIGRLTQAFNRMVEELRVKARIRDTFGKYIDPRIVQGLIERPELAAAAGERRTMTIFFCDMKGFTPLSEGLTPTALVNVINAYLTEMSTPIREQSGIIDKYIGDAIMAFWGMPFTAEQDQAKLACFAAVDQLERLGAFRARLPELMGIKRGLPQVDMRVGIATGEVVVGNIGSDVTKSYTVMGDTVNFASRIEGANKQYGTHVLISEATAEMAARAVETREIDSILVVGKSEPQRIFELLGRKGAIADPQARLGARYAEGLAAYRRQDWSAAEAAFGAALETVPGDGPSTVMLKRVAALRADPPGPGWDGVWRMSEK
ncbi:MAG: adenylate/guanylate cyclase domain-containing protein [Alphaproteobacteria bacterium]|nr:adenylate/guanylate cyclase domain-containing protein [Alphaproteobacteria bacterium]